MNLNQLAALNELILINQGGIAEQVVGQMLRTIEPFYIQPMLYCWHRNEPGSNAELDYILQFHHHVIPIEVKAGSTGSLKSLHLFMKNKQLSHAIRINSALPSVMDVVTKDHTGTEIRYQLMSLPFYLTEQIPRLLASQLT